jgi:hypothetical protein
MWKKLAKMLKKIKCIGRMEERKRNKTKGENV